jgi:hypothetical protein
MTLAKRMLCALLLLTILPVGALADCRVHARDRVILYGISGDPNVFVWDSRFRLRDYAGGSFDQAQALLPHAFLASPGTRAIVTSCVPTFVQSKFSGVADDAIGIMIIGGPNNGRTGWVLFVDVRPTRR